MLHSGGGKGGKEGMCLGRLTTLHSHFTWTGLSPINHSRHLKTRDIGLPDGEECIPLRSLVSTHAKEVTVLRHVTDRQTDGFAIVCAALAKLCFAEHCIISNFA